MSEQGLSLWVYAFRHRPSSSQGCCQHPDILKPSYRPYEPEIEPLRQQMAVLA